jgi:hypothetical protein
MSCSNINSSIQINDEITTPLNMHSHFEAPDKGQRNCNSEDVNTSPSKAKAGWRRAMRETPSFIEKKAQENLPKQIENAINNRQYEDALKLIDTLEKSVDPKVFNIFGNLLKSDCLKILDRPNEALFCREKAVQEIESEANRFKKRCKEEINRLHKEGLFPKTREEMEHIML